MKEMNKTNDPDSPLDSVIDRTLIRDAESARARFATVPNARLTAKLAMKTASRGLLPSLGGKLALYAGGALLVGGAIYFLPSLGQKSTEPVLPPMTPSIQQSLQNSSPGAKVTEMTKVSTKPTIPEAVTGSAHHGVPSAKPEIKLDEGNDNNIPRIVDSTYHTTLK